MAITAIDPLRTSRLISFKSPLWRQCVLKKKKRKEKPVAYNEEEKPSPAFAGVHALSRARKKLSKAPPSIHAPFTDPFHTGGSLFQPRAIFTGSQTGETRTSVYKWQFYKTRVKCAFCRSTFFLRRDAGEIF